MIRSPPSEVWIHFKKTLNGKKCNVLDCQLELKYCNSTSSLSKHLEKVKKIQLCSSLKRKRSESSEKAKDEEFKTDDAVDVVTPSSSGVIVTLKKLELIKNYIV